MAKAHSTENFLEGQDKSEGFANFHLNQETILNDSSFIDK